MTPAEEAARHWDGRILRLIRDRENHVFEMATPQGRAALRRPMNPRHYITNPGRVMRSGCIWFVFFCGLTGTGER